MASTRRFRMSQALGPGLTAMITLYLHSTTHDEQFKSQAIENVLRILDFGGGVGISFVHLKSGLVGDMELDYQVVELECACRMGLQLFENDHGIHFHRSLPELMEPLDIVFMKGVLMSIEDYAGLLK